MCGFHACSTNWVVNIKGHTKPLKLFLVIFFPDGKTPPTLFRRPPLFGRSFFGCDRPARPAGLQRNEGRPPSSWRTSVSTCLWQYSNLLLTVMYSYAMCLCRSHATSLRRARMWLCIMFWPLFLTIQCKMHPVVGHEWYQLFKCASGILKSSRSLSPSGGTKRFHSPGQLQNAGLWQGPREMLKN
jgi:hypothetical protein